MATTANLTGGISNGNGISPKSSTILSNETNDKLMNGDSDLLGESILDKLKAGLNGQSKNLLNSDSENSDIVLNGEHNMVTHGERKRPADSESESISNANPAKIARVQIEEITRKNEEIVKTITNRETPLTTQQSSRCPARKHVDDKDEVKPDSTGICDDMSDPATVKNADNPIIPASQSKGLLALTEKMRDYTKGLIQAASNKSISSSQSSSPSLSRTSTPSPDEKGTSTSTTKLLDKGNLFENLTDLTHDKNKKLEINRQESDESNSTEQKSTESGDDSEDVRSEKGEEKTVIPNSSENQSSEQEDKPVEPSEMGGKESTEESQQVVIVSSSPSPEPEDIKSPNMSSLQSEKEDQSNSSIDVATPQQNQSESQSQDLFDGLELKLSEYQDNTSQSLEECLPKGQAEASNDDMVEEIQNLLDEIPDDPENKSKKPSETNDAIKSTSKLSLNAEHISSDDPSQDIVQSSQESPQVSQESLQEETSDKEEKSGLDECGVKSLEQVQLNKKKVTNSEGDDVLVISSQESGVVDKEPTNEEGEVQEKGEEKFLKEAQFARNSELKGMEDCDDDSKESVLGDPKVKQNSMDKNSQLEENSGVNDKLFNHQNTNTDLSNTDENTKECDKGCMEDSSSREECQSIGVVNDSDSTVKPLTDEIALGDSITETEVHNEENSIEGKHHLKEPEKNTLIDSSILDSSGNEGEKPKDDDNIKKKDEQVMDSLNEAIKDSKIDHTDNSAKSEVNLQSSQANNENKCVENKCDDEKDTGNRPDSNLGKEFESNGKSGIENDNKVESKNCGNLANSESDTEKKVEDGIKSDSESKPDVLTNSVENKDEKMESPSQCTKEEIIIKPGTEDTKSTIKSDSEESTDKTPQEMNVEKSDNKPSISKKRSPSESFSEDDDSRAKKSRLDDVIGLLGNRIGMKPDEAAGVDSGSEEGPASDLTSDKTETSSTTSEDYADKTITLTTKELEKIIEKRINHYLNSHQGSLVIQMRKKMEELQTSIDAYKSLAKDLQKEMVDLSIKQHQRGDRRRSSARVQQRNMGIQVDDQKFQAVQLQKEQANHANLTVRTMPAQNKQPIQRTPPRTVMAPSGGVTTSMVTTVPGQVILQSQPGTSTATTAVGGVQTKRPTVRNMLDVQRGGKMAVPITSVGGQVVRALPTNRQGTVTTTSVPSKPVKGVIDLTDDDDQKSPPKTTKSVQGTMVRTLPAAQIGQIVRAPGGSATIRPGTVLLQQGANGGTPVVLQQVVQGQTIRSQGATYVLGSRPGGTVMVQAPNSSSLSRQMLPAGIRPGQQIVLQQRPTAPTTTVTTRPPPPLQSAPPANQVGARGVGPSSSSVDALTSPEQCTTPPVPYPPPVSSPDIMCLTPQLPPLQSYTSPYPPSCTLSSNTSVQTNVLSGLPPSPIHSPSNCSFYSYIDSTEPAFRQLLLASSPCQPASTPAKATFPSTSSQHPSHLSTPQQQFPLSIPQQTALSSTPRQAIFSTTPPQQSYSSDPPQPSLFTTSSQPTFSSTPHQPSLGASPPQQPTFSSTPHQPTFSSTPQQPVFSSTPQQPVFSSTPQQPVFSSTPQQPVFSSTPQQPVFSSTPQKPILSSTPQQPIFSSLLHGPTFSSTPRPPSLSSIRPSCPVVPGQPSLSSTPYQPPVPSMSVGNTQTLSSSMKENRERIICQLKSLQEELRQRLAQANSNSLVWTKHPAPLPPVPVHPNANNLPKLSPPKPGLKISRVQQGIVLSWNMTVTDNHAEIVNYQLFAYQVGSAPPSSSLWKKVGDVKALPLPMACTLTQFQEGNKYFFSVRAVDTHSRIGQFSDPSSIHLLPTS